MEREEKRALSLVDMPDLGHSRLEPFGQPNPPPQDGHKVMIADELQPVFDR